MENESDGQSSESRKQRFDNAGLVGANAQQATATSQYDNSHTLRHSHLSWQQHSISHLQQHLRFDHLMIRKPHHCRFYRPQEEQSKYHSEEVFTTTRSKVGPHQHLHQAKVLELIGGDTRFNYT
jgi:hypothetical protein